MVLIPIEIFTPLCLNHFETRKILLATHQQNVNNCSATRQFIKSGLQADYEERREKRMFIKDLSPRYARRLEAQIETDMKQWERKVGKGGGQGRRVSVIMRRQCMGLATDMPLIPKWRKNSRLRRAGAGVVAGGQHVSKE